MKEFPECYKLTNYIISKEFREKVKALDLVAIHKLPHDSLGDDSYTAHFVVPTELEYSQASNKLYGIEFPTNLISVRDEAYQISLDMLNSVFPNHIIVRGGLAGLAPGGVQHRHQDPRVFHRFCRRVHLPIVTNPDAKLCVGDNEYHFPEDTIWVFDNLTQYHWSKNLGNSIRYHILLDIIPKDRLDFILSNITGDDLYSMWYSWAGRDNLDLIKKLGLEKENQIQRLPSIFN